MESNQLSAHLIDKIYPLKKFDHKASFVPNHQHYADIDIKNFELVRKVPTASQIKNMLIREKLQGIYALNEMNGNPYLEYNAPTRGDFGFIDSYEYKLAVSGQCQKSVVWFLGESSGLHYVKKIDCRKHWCPVCGGKDGNIHKNRIHSVLKRVDVDQFNIRQFVLTVPESLRDKLKDRESINKLILYSKQLTEKFFGVPVFDKRGHVKKYHLEKGCISYLHLFGDEQSGVYKPHVNVHILEDKKTKLILSESILNSIRKYWLKKLRQFDESLSVVDVHYKFRINKGHKLHAIKYMTKAWGVDDFNQCDDELKKFLVMEMSGFQYLRFWGALANCNYKDEFNCNEEKADCESKVGEKLTALYITPFNDLSWSNRMVEIDKGFYLILQKEKKKNEPEKRKGKEKNV